MFFFPRLAGFRGPVLATQLDEEAKKFFENAKGVPRKSDRPLQGQRALRGFSSSPRKKDLCEKEAPTK